MTQETHEPEVVAAENEPQNAPDVPFAEAKPSAPRRLMGLAVIYMLGGLLLYISFVKPPAELLWQVFLILFGLLIMYLGERMRKATLQSIFLTAEGLVTSDGIKIVDVDNVKSIDRGVFAFKPSNGFTVLMHKKQARAWSPGIWWRLGRRVGVGGVIQASQTKSMAEILAMMVHQRMHGPDENMEP
ncbi:hypothetical protein AB9F29_12585 [Falsihalocynthiibacter sp. S25ZX9]|uniref:hypothetical protein n=1 Tax=Falsihalocynthiibacter sp. S25ZX9 TaxID=3240870 RepID=UPI00350E9A64